MNKHFASIALASSFLLALPACRSAGDEPDLDHRVDNAMLANVPDGDRGDIDDTRVEATAAHDAWSAAQARLRRSKVKLDLAQEDLDVAKARKARADAAVELAQSGTTEDLDKARKEMADARALVRAAETRISLRRKQVDHAQAYLDLKQKQYALAQAKAEAAKARAVHDLDRPQAKSIDVARFDKQVRDAQEAVNIAKVKADAARKEVEIVRGRYDNDVEAVPASYRKDWPKEEDLPKD